MVLRHAPTPPLVRKVIMLLREKGPVDRAKIDAFDGCTELEVVTAEPPYRGFPRCCSMMARSCTTVP